MNNFNLELMSVSELIELRKKIESALLEKAVIETFDAVDFYKYLSKALDVIIGQPLPPLLVLKKKSPQSYKKLVAVTHFINEYMAHIGWGEHDRKNTYQLYVKLVALYIDERGFSVNLSTFLNLHEKFPTLLDDAFPGYIPSGAISFLASTMERRNKEGIDTGEDTKEYYQSYKKHGHIEDDD